MLLGNTDSAWQYHEHNDKGIITCGNCAKQSALTYFTLCHLSYNLSHDGTWLEVANN